MKRLNSQLSHDAAAVTPAYWEALKEAVMQTHKLEPFAQVEDVRLPGFRYLPSENMPPRFEILEGDAPYTATTTWKSEYANYLPKGVGKVEIEIAGFILDPRPDLAVVIGGMGSGKSTSLRQMNEWLAANSRIHYLNCDKKASDPESPPPAIDLLVTYLAPLAVDLVGPNEEFRECWNWALERYGRHDLGESANSAMVLQPAVEELRLRFGEAWKAATDESIKLRKDELFKKVCNDSASRLDYYALLLDYYLTVKCADERQKLCIIFDNVDPFPPKLQRQLLLRTAQLQSNARCKIIISMRPLTYSLTHEQRANRTVKVIQHNGPSALELIGDRLRRLVIETDYPKLKLEILQDGKPGREIDQADFKAWIHQVLDDINNSRPAGGQRSMEPSAAEFIEGLCNNSLRSALLVAEKIFGSPNLPIIRVDDDFDSDSDASHATMLKNHEIIRAVLLGKKPYFFGDINRVTDNLFDFGDATTCFSLTCKYRILKELASAPGRGILRIDELCSRLRPFGYSDAVILEAINGVISQVKRLAWSDMVVAYDNLQTPLGSRLSISRAGRFYVEKAVFSLEYLQEAHLDALVPESLLPTRYVHKSFIDRSSSLYQFLRHLHDVDLKEVQLALTTSKSRYYETYGTTLFSTVISEALSKQLQNIAQSILRRQKTDSTYANSMRNEAEKWGNLSTLLTAEDRVVTEALKTQRGTVN